MHGGRVGIHSVDYEPFITPEIGVVRDHNRSRHGLNVNFRWTNCLFERGL